MIKVIALYLFIVIAAIIFYISFIDKLSLLLLITVILFPLALFALLALVSSKTKISFFCEKAGAEKANDVNFNVRMHNATFLPLPKVKISLHYKNILTNEGADCEFYIPLHFSRTQNLRFSISSAYCGKISAVIDEVVFYDYLSLLRIKKRPALQCSTIILPDICDGEIAISQESEFAGMREVYSKTKPGDDNSEIFDMRDYKPGDKISQIHQKLSIKYDSLIVKEYSKPINSNVMLLFDFNSQNADAIDALADLLISLSYSMIERDSEHYVCIYSASEKALKQFDIDSREKCILMARSIMSTPCFDNACAIERFCEREDLHSYSHVIYACAKMSDTQSALALHLSHDVKTDVIAFDTNDVKSLDELSDFADIHSLQKGRIDILLSELYI